MNNYDSFNMNMNINSFQSNPIKNSYQQNINIGNQGFNQANSYSDSNNPFAELESNMNYG